MESRSATTKVYVCVYLVIDGLAGVKSVRYPDPINDRLLQDLLQIFFALFYSIIFS